MAVRAAPITPIQPPGPDKLTLDADLPRVSPRRLFNMPGLDTPGSARHTPRRMSVSSRGSAMTMDEERLREELDAKERELVAARSTRASLMGQVRTMGQATVRANEEVRLMGQWRPDRRQVSRLEARIEECRAQARAQTAQHAAVLSIYRMLVRADRGSN